MGIFVDIKGQTYGKLKVIKRVPNKYNKVYWRCKCECGNIKDIRSNDLRSNKTLSCGCLQRSIVTKHGASNGRGQYHALYTTWKSMTRRCRDPNYEQYKDYGGRGIRVCKEWRKSYISFRDYMLSLPNCPKNVNKWNEGNRLERSIDRINNEKGYRPGNMKWSTHEEQMRNRRI